MRLQPSVLRQLVVQTRRDAHGQRDCGLRHAAVAGERTAPGPAGFQADVRRRRHGTAAGGPAGFAPIVLRHENIAAILPVRRQSHQPRLVRRGPGRVVLLQRPGHLRGHRQPRSVAGLEAGPVQLVAATRRQESDAVVVRERTATDAQLQVGQTVNLVHTYIN